MNRYLTLWLVLILGLPVIGTLALTAAYQVLLGSVSFYPFWLAEIYLILWFPASLGMARLVYWGKRKPIPYFYVTCLLLLAIILFGTGQLVDDFGPIIQDRLVIKGVQNESLITEEKTFRLAYLSYDQKKMTEAIRKEIPVVVHRLEGKEEVLVFADSAFIYYPLSERLLNLLIGLLSSAAFLILFIHTLGAWTRKVECIGNYLVVRRWWRQVKIPFQEIIFIRVDLEKKEVSVETEEMAMELPYGPGMREVLLKTVEMAGLVGLLPDQWVRQRQFEEISITDEKLIIESETEMLSIPFSSVTRLTWEGVIRLIDEEESEYLITDSRYVDKAWFGELALRIQSVWTKERYPYQQEVNPISGIESLVLKDV